MKTIEVEKEFDYGGKKYKPGDKVDLPDDVAERVMDKGAGVETLGDSEIEISGEEEETEEGINVENLLPGGLFLSHEDVEEGDQVTIKGSGEIDDSFDNDRLVLPVKYMGEEARVSLGPENVERTSNLYGMNTKSWIGKKLEVALIKKYKGLGKKGIVWKPVKEE